MLKCTDLYGTARLPRLTFFSPTFIYGQGTNLEKLKTIQATVPKFSCTGTFKQSQGCIKFRRVMPLNTAPPEVALLPCGWIRFIFGAPLKPQGGLL